MAAVAPCNVPDHVLQPMQASPAFAKAAGEDARMLQAVAEAHAAFERSLLSSKQQAGNPTAETTVSRGKDRAYGLQASQAHGPVCSGLPIHNHENFAASQTTRLAHLLPTLFGPTDIEG